MLGTEIGRGVIPVTLDRRGFDSDVDKMGSSVGSKFKKVGKLAAAGMAAGLVGTGVLLKGSIEAASDLGEATSKASQIFGAQAIPGLERFAASAAKNLGQSKLSAIDAAASFGVFGKVAGLEGKELTGFSTNLVKLSSDMASFSNTSPEEAVQALGAALRGESEPIRRYGVMLDDATLKAEALALGILKPVKDQAKIQSYHVKVLEGQKAYNDAVAEFGPNSMEALKAEAALGSARESLRKATEGTIPPLTAQQKVLAAQSAIMKQTGDQQGDFARTSGGLANQQRILTAQFENVKVAIGQQLLPVAVNLFTFANDKLIPVAFRLADGFAGFAKTIGSVVGPAVSTLKGLFGGGGGGGGITGIIGGALQEVVGLYKAKLALWKAIWDRWGADILALLGNLFKTIGGVVSGALKVIRGIIKVATGLLTGDWKKVWSGLGDIVGGAFKIISSLIKGALKAAMIVIKAGLKLIGDAFVGLFFKAIPAAVEKGFRAVKNEITTSLKNAGTTVRDLLGKARDTFDNVFNTLIPNKVSSGFTKVKTTVRTGLDAARDIVVELLDKARDKFDNIFTVVIPTKVGNGLDKVKTAVRTGVDAARDTAATILEAIATKFLGIFTDRLPAIVGRGVAAIGRVWDDIKAAAREPVRFVVETVFNNGLRKVINAIPGVGTIDPIKFAKGGPVRGGIPRKDSVNALLMPGEHVLTADEVAALGGQDAVLKLRKSIRKGDFLPHYAAGGAFPDPSGRTYWGSEPISRILKAQLLLAQKLSKTAISVMQGSWQPATDYSGTSHTGSGVADTSPGTFDQQYWQRRVGIAAWARNIPGAAYAGSGAHIHGISRLDPAARGHSQLASYAAGGDGLGGTDYGPRPALLPNLLKTLGAMNLSLSGGGPGIDTGFITTIKDILSKVGDWTSHLKSMGGWGGLMRDMVTSVVGSMKGWLGDKIASVLGAVGNVKDNVVDLLKGAGKGIAGFVGGLFDGGGILRSGRFGVNMSGRPERVLDPRTTENFERLVDMLTTRGVYGPGLRGGSAIGEDPEARGLTVQFNGPVTTTDVDKLARRVTVLERRALAVAGLA